MAHGDMYENSKGTLVLGAFALLIFFGGIITIGCLAINDARTRSAQLEACRQKNAGVPCEIKSLAVPKE